MPWGRNLLTPRCKINDSLPYFTNKKTVGAENRRKIANFEA
nr:MAG TPA: hypothetical protein [Bacteriophage sp.]